MFAEIKAIEKQLVDWIKAEIDNVTIERNPDLATVDEMARMHANGYIRVSFLNIESLKYRHGRNIADVPLHFIVVIVSNSLINEGRMYEWMDAIMRAVNHKRADGSNAPLILTGTQTPARTKNKNWVADLRFETSYKYED